MATEQREYYPSGKLKSVWFEINGKKEGEYKEYHIMNGQIWKNYNYVNGKKHGEQKHYYENIITKMDN